MKTIKNGTDLLLAGNLVRLLGTELAPVTMQDGTVYLPRRIEDGETVRVAGRMMRIENATLVEV